MRVLLALLLLAGQARAEDDRMSEGMGLLSEGARMILEALKHELAPTLEGLAAEAGPALEGLKDWLGNLDAYELPEVLPNGDILIRRKVAPEPDEVEL